MFSSMGQAAHARPAHGFLIAFGPVVALLAACSAYDSGALPATVSAAPHADVTDASLPIQGRSDGGQAGSDAAGRDAAVFADAGGDAGALCVPNPGSDACPEICPELCNGEDDDCDGEADEAEAANAGCEAEHAVSVCQRGACRVIECLDGYRDCDRDAMTGCETALEDPSHCGQCGRACALENAIAACVEGECVALECEPGHGDCDGDGQGCETPLVSLEHCGACGTSCGGLDRASPQCATGACGVKECLGNFGDCNGDFADGCETSLDSLQHCGACNTVCAKASCGGGVCTAVVCAKEAADCDLDEVDCEVDLTADVQHCGGCGRPCAFRTTTPRAALACADGDCRAICDPGYGDCDEDYASGCETALASSPAHCGGCGNDCAAMLPHTAVATCVSGSCSVVTCDNGWDDCDGDDANGCERNVTADGPCFPDTNCTRRTHGGHEYFFCTGSRAWAAARDRCRMQTRGDLVSIGSSAENAFVTMHRTANSWIGANDAAIEGLWRWESNRMPFWRGLGDGAVVLSQYANWSSPQPDDWQGGEDCAELWVDGKWNDGGCNNARAFVCEVGPDECPSDAGKTDPGQCGCGTADDDGDGDGFANCADTCEDDPGKQSPGACGCGVADTDSDGDATPDCNDACPADPSQTAACLGFAPANFDPRPIDWSARPVATLNCGTTTVNTTDPDGAGPLVATITNWCGTAPVPMVQAQAGGPEAVIIALRGLSLTSGNTLRLLGARPAIFAVDGDVNVAGTIDADASGTSAGAGGNWNCGGSAGGNGSGDSNSGASGGGGGGFGTAGGLGGTGGGGSRGAAGSVRGGADLTPLLGGCNGGRGGGCSAAGAAGGGAFQITASGTLAASGTLHANGASGSAGCGSEGGGSGGGSGGAIFLEAATLGTITAVMQANGGRGGAGAGGPSGGNGSTSSGASGTNGGNDCCNGGSGAGGGYGRIRSVDR